jgi:hypothetical protein
MPKYPERTYLINDVTADTHTTRWASRSYSLFTFLSAFVVVCSSVEELEHSGVFLVAVQSILQPLVPLSATPQTKYFDLIQAVVESKTVIDLRLAHLVVCVSAVTSFIRYVYAGKL